MTYPDNQDPTGGREPDHDGPEPQESDGWSLWLSEIN